jgi:hypothetical protein
VASEAWFEAIARDDINSRVVSRARLQRKDPGMSALMRWGRSGTAPPLAAALG